MRLLVVADELHAVELETGRTFACDGSRWVELEHGSRLDRRIRARAARMLRDDVAGRPDRRRRA